MREKRFFVLAVLLTCVFVILNGCSSENSQEYEEQVMAYLEENGTHGSKLLSLMHEDNFGTSSYKLSYKNEILKLNQEYNEFISNINFTPKSKADKKEHQLIKTLIENDLKRISSLNKYIITNEHVLFEEFTKVTSENTNILRGVYN